MAAVTSLGSENFYLLALPLLYWCWDKKKAIYTGAVFLVAISLNDIMKTVFQHPRPDPAKLLPGIRELATHYMPSEPGFPSGHAQGSVAFWGSLAVTSRNRALWAICTVIIILVSYSRLYLGVHYTGDVIGGFLMGLVCLAAVIPIANSTAKHYHRFYPAAVIAVLIILPIAATMLLPGNMLAKDMGTISGFLIGAYIAEKKIGFNPLNRIIYQAAKVVIGIAGLAAIRFGLKAILPDLPISDFFRYWLVGAWVSIGAPYIFSRFSTLKGEEQASEQ
jgi:hypothetical protein